VRIREDPWPEVFLYKQNGPQACACGPPGGLFGIDQEVVTLRGLYGNSGLLEDVSSCQRSWPTCVRRNQSFTHR